MNPGFRAWYSSFQITSLTYIKDKHLVTKGFSDQNKSTLSLKWSLKTQTEDTVQRKWHLKILVKFRPCVSIETGTHYSVESDLCIPEVFWGSQFSARRERQSVSMTRGYQVHSQLYYVRYHMPGEGSIVRDSRRLPESASSLQIQQIWCEDQEHQKELTMNSASLKH